MKPRVKVAVAGFGPFPRMPRNPSATLVAALAGSRRFAAAGIAISATILPTEYEAARRALANLLATRPDAVILFGVAGRRGPMRIETIARNRASTLHPDAARFTPQRREILTGGAPAIRLRAHAQSLLHAARACGTPARLSRDAGGYLCNACFYQALAHGTHAPKVVAFVHIPLPRPNLPRRRRKRKIISPPFESLRRGAEAIVWRAALTAARLASVPERDG
jgi:pyroglutamyl-peptidase